LRPVKIMHCGDFHFDTPFQELPGALAEHRREDLRETFGRMILLAKEEKIDLLLIAGDLFDNRRVSRMTVNYLTGKLREIPQVRIFISPGNHDPYYEKSYYHLVPWPDNVHVFKGSLEKVVLQELNTCVFGRGFTWAYQQESFLKGFAADNRDPLNIMVLHGDVVQPGQNSDYNPLQENEIKSSGLDYLALGHRHTYTKPVKSGETFWAYSGCPEGRGFDELGDKGVLLGELVKGSCSLEYRSLCKRKYFDVKIDVSGCRTNEDIAGRILNSAAHLDPAGNLFKIVLVGELPEGFFLYRSVIEDKLKDSFYFLKINDGTRTAVDLGRLAGDFSLKGVFVKKVKERLEKAEDEKERKRLEMALKYGLQVLEEGKVVIE